MSTDTYKIKHYHGNKSTYIPMWVKAALKDLEVYLDDCKSLDKNYKITEIRYYKKSKFLMADFREFEVLTDTMVESLQEIGWTFEWFQSFEGGGFVIQFKFRKID